MLLIRELTARVSELTARVAELREQLGAARRTTSRNSGNSSLPPSGDDQPRRQPRRERRAAERAEKKRSRGKQPGSPGAAMRWRKPDETLDHYPQGACACGRVHVAERPDGLPDAPLSVGPRLSVMAVFQHVPVERAQWLISDLTGGVVSAGFVHSCVARAAGLVKDPVALIRAWHAAREQGLPAVPAEIREPLELEFRRAVTVGLEEGHCRLSTQCTKDRSSSALLRTPVPARTSVLVSQTPSTASPSRSIRSIRRPARI